MAIFFSENFNGNTGSPLFTANGTFNASGFAPTPATGQLDSDFWRVAGFSDNAGLLDYGGTVASSTDYGRGAYVAQTTAGIYSINTGITALGASSLIVKPTGAEFGTTPGTITLRVQYTGVTALTGFTVDYDAVFRNSQGRDSFSNFSWAVQAAATQPSTFSSTVTALSFITPVTADALGWQRLDLAAQTFTQAVNTNDYIFLRWSIGDGPGPGASGSRDEIGFDNISIDGISAPANPTISVAPATISQNEGNGGTTAFTYTVTRSDTSADASVTVTINGTGGSPIDAADIASVTVDGVPVAGFSLGTGFAVNLTGVATTASVVVNINGDTTVEPNETFNVALSGPTGGTYVLGSQATSTGTVQNDDSPTISISPATLAQDEGNAGVTPFTFTVTRSTTASDATVQVTITGGAGLDAADITSVTVDGVPIGGFVLGAAFTVNLSGAATTASVVINVAGDATIEATENFTVALSAPTGGYVLGSNASSTATISNDDFTRIYDIQGSGTTSALVGQTVTIRAVVTGDFQNGDADTTRNLNGFNVQELTGDGNAATSDGIFIFQGTGATNTPNVNVGDIVTITGVVSEFNGETQISATGAGAVTVTTPGALTQSQVNALAVTLNLPSTGVVSNTQGIVIPNLEAYEGMLVTLPQTLTVSETFNLDRFGTFEVTQAGQAFQYTQLNTPNAPGYATYVNDIAARTLTIDDGIWTQNPDIRVGGTALTSTSTFSHGDTISNVTGIIRYSNPIGTTATTGATGEQNYRLMATEAFTVTDTNPREAAPPPVGGNLKVASFNVLNFFTSLNTTSGTDPSFSGQDPRGADNDTEFGRQSQKLYNTLATMNADIVSLIELENDFRAGGNTGPGTVAAGAAGATSIQAIVNGLNAIVGAGTYDWVRPGSDLLGGDAISVGMIYKTASVSIAPGTTIARLVDTDEVGGTEPDAQTTDLADLGLTGLLTNNPGIGVFEGNGTSRVPLAVTFVDAAGESFTVVANHFKSKSSSAGGTGDADAGDGAGQSNNQRVEAATAVTAWLAANPTGDTSGRFLIVGDLNAYAKEAPIQYILGQGYTNLADSLIGASAYSYVFDGLIGTLDYGLANAGFTEFFTGAADWHINSDEADAFDYNTNFRPPSQTALFDATSAIRTSDHDPFIMGIDLTTNYARFGSNAFTGVRELSSRSFDTVQGGAGAGDAIDVLREAQLGNIGLQNLVVNNLTIRADGSIFKATFQMTGAVTQLRLAGTAALSANGAGGDDTIIGNDGANRLDLGAGADFAIGGLGADTILGGDGVDTIYAGDDADYAQADAGASSIIDGGAGNDTLYGGVGDDYLVGGNNDDILAGFGGANSLYGGSGADYLVAGDGAGSVVDGGEGNDSLYGGSGNDYFVGGDDDDVLVGLGGADWMYAGAGADYIVSGDGPGAVIDGAAGADSIYGGTGDETILGGAGSDIIVAGGGADFILGGADDDMIYAGAGSDHIFGDGGTDSIYTDDIGGNARDYVYAAAGSGVDTVWDFKAGNAADADIVVITGGLFTNYAQVRANMTFNGSYTVVDLNGTDQLLLYNVTPRDLTANNFILL